MSNADRAMENARYEIKFNANVSHYEDLIGWLHRHPACFSSPFPSRKINNIYFDNLDLDSYQENLSGVSSRTKLRLRWYGETFNPPRAALELKMRRNKLGWKLSHDIILGNSKLTSLTWRELEEELRQQVPPDLGIHLLLSSFPVLVNRYNRDYFLSSDGLVRVTVDTNLKYYDQRNGNGINCSFENIAPEILVMEFKSAASDTDSLESAIESVTLQKTRNSKYVTGLSSILGV